MLLMRVKIYIKKDMVLPLVGYNEIGLGALDKDTLFLTKSKFKKCYLYLDYILIHLYR